MGPTRGQWNASFFSCDRCSRRDDAGGQGLPNHSLARTGARYASQAPAGRCAALGQPFACPQDLRSHSSNFDLRRIVRIEPIVALAQTFRSELCLEESLCCIGLAKGLIVKAAGIVGRAFDHARSALKAGTLVGSQPLLQVATIAFERAGKDKAILDRHYGTGGKEGQCGMCCIPKQSYVTHGPSWQRFAQDQRPQERLFDCCHHSVNVDMPALEIMGHVRVGATGCPRLIAPSCALHHTDEVHKFAPPQRVLHGMPVWPDPGGANWGAQVLGQPFDGDGTAPSDKAGELCCTRSEKLASDDRMNAVGANEHVSVNATPVSKVEASGSAVLVMADHARAEMQCRGYSAFQRLHEYAEEVRPVECHIRKTIGGHRNGSQVKSLPRLSRVPHAEFAADRLCGHRHHRIHQAESMEDTHGTGAHLDAGADLPHLASLFVDLDIEAALRECERRRQPADPTASNQHLEGIRFAHAPFVSSRIGSPVHSSWY